MQIKRFVIGMIDNNDYLVWDENTNAAALIDATDNRQEIADEVLKLGLNLQYIILTHGHFDHTTGTKFYQAAFPKAKLVACKREAKMLYERGLSHGPGGIVADIWVKDGDNLDLGDLSLKFIETPGHSKGSMCILTEDVLFSGDTLFQCSVGRTDLPTGSMEDLMASLKEKLFVLPEI